MTNYINNFNFNQESNTFKESRETFFARIKLKMMLVQGFKNSKPRLPIIKLLEEVPATFPDKKYKADFGILLTTSDYNYQYFFIIEIDGKVGHGTSITRLKEDERDTLFFDNFGAVTVRIPLRDITNLENLTEAIKYFHDYIFNIFELLYLNIDKDFGVTSAVRELNTKFAAKIAENQSTHCPDCPHLNNDHDLGGCAYQFAIDPKKICNCKTAFLRSEK